MIKPEMHSGIFLKTVIDLAILQDTKV